MSDNVVLVEVANLLPDVELNEAALIYTWGNVQVTPVSRSWIVFAIGALGTIMLVAERVAT